MVVAIVQYKPKQPNHDVERFGRISPKKEREKIYFIEFEDFVVNPFPYMEGLENFIGEPFGKASKRILKRERCPRKLEYSERELRIKKIRSSIGGDYDDIFMKLLQDYDSKPWLDWK